jgi:hypothetical protein
VILQWTTRQIHDTVAAIARRPVYGASRQSVLGRIVRYLIDKLDRLTQFFRGSREARLVVFAAIVLVILLIVARVVIAKRAEERDQKGFSLRGVRGEHVDYLALAAGEAEAGRFAEACHAVYGAVLESLVRSGAVRFHQSKTSGDYSRELHRRGSPLFAPFRAFARDFDGTMFGKSSVDRADYDRLHASATTLGRTRAAA